MYLNDRIRGTLTSAPGAYFMPVAMTSDSVAPLDDPLTLTSETWKPPDATCEYCGSNYGPETWQSCEACGAPLPRISLEEWWEKRRKKWAQR